VKFIVTVWSRSVFLLFFMIQIKRYPKNINIFALVNIKIKKEI